MGRSIPHPGFRRWAARGSKAAIKLALGARNAREAHGNRSITLHALNRYEEAVAAYDQALALAKLGLTLGC
jgi:predicted RNA polymerase sigma factor